MTKRHEAWIAVVLPLLFMLLPTSVAGNSHMFKSLSISDGLTQNTARTILRDSKGYLWIGTRYGLNRYDYNRFVNYYHTLDANSIPDNDIRLVFEDKLGQIWVAGHNGTAIYNETNNDFELVPLPDGRPLNIRSYYFATDDYMLLGGAGELYRYKYAKRQIKRIPLEGGSRQFYTHILPWTNGQLLLVTRWDGVFIADIKNGTARRVPFIQAREIMAAAIDSEQNLWISPYGEGVQRYDVNGNMTLNARKSNSGLGSDIVLDILDTGNEVWMATDGAGVNVYDKLTGNLGRLKRAPQTKRINSVVSLYTDTFGNIYAGTVRDGMVMVHPTAIATYPVLGPDNTELIVTDIVRHNGDVYYAAEDVGVARFDPISKDFDVIPCTADLKVTGLASLNDNTLMVSTFGDGLFYLVDDKNLYPADGVFAEIVKINAKKGVALELQPIAGNRMAVSTDVVYLCDPASQSYETLRPVIQGVTPGHLRPFYSDHNSVWFAGSNAVLSLNLTTRQFELIYRSPSGESVHSAVHDGKQTLYVAADSSITEICMAGDKRRQLPNIPHRISSLALDGKRLWIGANSTLYSHDLTTGHTREFGTWDGVMPNEFIPRATYVDKDIVAMGGVNGLMMLDKHRLDDLSVDPTGELHFNLADIDVDGVSAFSKVKDGHIDIHPNHSSLEISIIDLERNTMRSKLFRYIIKSDKEERVVETSNRRFQLPMLPSGEYDISVQCNNVNGGWSAPVSILTLNVLAPWWRSWWAILLYFLLVGVIGFSLYRYRRSRRQRRMMASKRHSLEKEVGFLVNINRELRTPLSLIFGPLRLLTQKLKADGADEEVIGDLQNITRQAEKMRDVINLSMEMWRTKAVESTPEMKQLAFNPWVREVVGEFRSAAESKEIKLDLQEGADAGEVEFDAGRMSVVLNNMIVRGLQSCHQGQTVTVFTSGNAETATLGISYPANGLDAAGLAGLFNHYNSTDDSNFDTGLGLAYAKILVEMHNGIITAELTSDGNLLIEARIPRSNQHVAEDLLPETAGTVAPGTENNNVADVSTDELTVVVADTDRELVNFIQRELKNRFRSVSGSSSRAEALIKIRNVEPDLIITGIVDLCAAVKSSPDLKHIPVLFIGDATTDLRKEEVYNAGADSYLTKPFDMQVLLSRSSNLLFARAVLKERYSKNSAGMLQEPQKNNADETFLLKINEIIEQNIHDAEFSINQLVQQMLMSRSSVYTRFKEITGQSLGNYITDFKLRRAKELLTDQALSVNEISEMLGFSSQRYFATFFKGKTGMSPTAWRQEAASHENHNVHAEVV